MGFFTGRAGVGAFVRDFHERRRQFWTFFDDEDDFVFYWATRGKFQKIILELIDGWDWSSRFRQGRQGKGWKDHKRRRQWEHRLREQEKHRKNRERKAVHRRGYLTENESDSE